MLGKVFKAYDVRATYPCPLNEKLAWQIGYGAAEHLLERGCGLLGGMIRWLATSWSVVICGRRAQV